MSLVIQAHDVKDLDSTYFVSDNFTESIDYILSNSMNSILTGVYNSTDSILAEIKHTLSSNDAIFKILLSVASASLIVSMIVLFPVAYKVATNKGKVLSLFLSIKKKAINEQLKKCEHSYKYIKISDNDKP